MRLLFVLALAAAPAFAQVESREGIALQNEILELRQQVQQLQGQQGGGPAPAPVYQPAPAGGPAGGSDLSADLVVRVGALEEQVRTLQGRVDELNQQLQRQHDELAKQIGDLAFKLGQGGGAGPGTDQVQTPPADSGDAVAAPAAPAPTPRRTPELLLKQANNALNRRDYAGAEAAAQQAVAAGGPRTTDAQFVLARAQAGQRQYQAAAAAYYGIYQRAPRSGRAPEALLGVAGSLLALGDTKDACQAVAKLTAEFPRQEAGIRAGAASIRKRARCR